MRHASSSAPSAFSLSYYSRLLKRALFRSRRAQQHWPLMGLQGRREKMRPHSASHRVRPIVLRADDGMRLNGWLMTPRWPEVRGAVLYFTNGSEETLWLAAQAPVMFPEMTILVMQYRPASSRDSRIVAEERVVDGIMLYDWLANSHRHLPGLPIVLMGRGFGAGIATSVASLRVAAALVLFSPCDAVQPAPGRLGLLKRRVRGRTEQAFQLKQPSPILVLRAEKDTVVTAACSNAFLVRLPSGIDDKVFLDADHYDLPYRQGSQDTIAAFLGRHVTPPRIGEQDEMNFHLQEGREAPPQLAMVA